MKNKLIIFFIILLQISLFNKTLSKEIEFNSSDIEKLIHKVQQTVNEKAGVNLELEIKIIGE